MVGLSINMDDFFASTLRRNMWNLPYHQPTILLFY